MGFREVARDVHQLLDALNAHKAEVQKAFELQENRWQEMVPRHNAVVGVLSRNIIGRLKWLLLGK